MSNDSKLEGLAQLVTSNDWRDYLFILKDRKEFLQNEVNRFVRDQDLFKAYGALCKLEDIDKTLSIVSQKLREITKGS